MKLDHRSRPALGFLFITVSLVAVVQSGRELIFWEVGERRDEDHPVLHELPLHLGDRTFTVVDDQPVDSGPSQAEHEGTIQLVMDGQPLGPVSRAKVRRAQRDLGRYHLWVDAWAIRDRRTDQTTLWFVRRLEPSGRAVTVVRSEYLRQGRAPRDADAEDLAVGQQLSALPLDTVCSARRLVRLSVVDARRADVPAHSVRGSDRHTHHWVPAGPASHAGARGLADGAGERSRQADGLRHRVGSAK